MNVTISADTLIYLGLLARDVAEGPDEDAALALEHELSEIIRMNFEPRPKSEQTHLSLVRPEPAK